MSQQRKEQLARVIALLQEVKENEHLLNAADRAKVQEVRPKAPKKAIEILEKVMAGYEARREQEELWRLESDVNMLVGELVNNGEQQSDTPA